mgnify:CR=1 FL=1
MHLFEIAKEHRAAYDDLSSCGMTAEEIADSLAAIDASFDDKIIACAYVARSLKAELTAVVEAGDHLDKRKKTLTNKIVNIESYMIAGMEAIQKRKVDHAIFPVTLKKPTKVVYISEKHIHTLPKRYQNTKTTTTVDKKGLKEALNLGEYIEHASLIDGKQSIRY